MSSPEPATPRRRRSWPLFTRAASPSGAGVPTQPASRAVQLLVITLCGLLLLAPLTLLFLGAPTAPASPSSRLWVKGPAQLLAAARQSFLGKYLAKPQRTSTTLPYPIEDGSYVSTSPSSSHSIAKIDDFPAHRQDDSIGSALQAFVQRVPQHASWAAGALLALPGSVGQQLGLIKRSSWSDSLRKIPQELLRSASDRLWWGKSTSWQDSVQAWSVTDAYQGLQSKGRQGFAVGSHWASAISREAVHARNVAVMAVRTLFRKQREMAVDFWDLVGPGGKLHPEDFIEYHGDVLVQLLLLAVCLYLLKQQRAKPSGKREPALSEQEIQQLCNDWKPEPLAEAYTAMQIQALTIRERHGAHVTLQGDDQRSKLNLVSNDFLGLSQNKAIEKECIKTIEKYGVGSCGPRGFYGTIDVHLTVEARLAEFMGTEECILYSYDMATVPSVIPAFANAKDIILADEASNYAIQNGCTLSRAKTYYFKHNDMHDLERLLRDIDAAERRKKKPLNRRFIVTEGVFASTGDLAPLRAIHELKTRFKYRMVVDESFALGVLGDNGRGACELAGLQPGDVEIVCSSLGNSMGSVGGMCVGTRDVVDHQRLSGLGYCFSASLPPFLASATTAALDQLQLDASSDGLTLQQRLLQNAAELRRLLADVPGVRLLGASEPALPLLHLQLAEQPAANGRTEAQVLQAIADQCLDRGALVSVHQISPLDRWQQRPSLRLTVSALHEQHDIARAVECLSSAVQQVLSGKSKAPTGPVQKPASRKK